MNAYRTSEDAAAVAEEISDQADLLREMVGQLTIIA